MPRIIHQTPTHEGPVTEACEQARATGEPRFVPVRYFADDRGWSIMNQFQGVLGPEGQVNYSVMYPGVVKAWHRHQKQTDFWLVLHGHLKIGVHREADDAAWQRIVGEKQPGVVIIPPPLWHGAATVGPEPAGLLYYVTQPYNPAEPDEQRRPYDQPADFPWEVQHH